ncbi:hypothetical protein BJV78DRAFT_1376974 [Lactifluus subvellereus]|nr:hypothetical protein BJV78DRAFT_1376974 [Lactifluus subvellereus]
MSPAPLLPQELELGKENQEAPRASEYQARTLISSLVTETGEGRAHASTYLGADDSLLQHEKYFFNDGNITFLVDGTLYCIHRYFFSRDSEYFSTRFSQLGIRDHEALPTIISLGDIERRDFEAFLSVIYPEDFEKHGLCYEEWVSVLHLSTRWGFASLRKLALASINPPTPHDQLLLARRYSIGDWVLPALSSLCERTAPLTLDEARQMNIEDVVIVATVRENIRNDTLQVDAAEIPRRVEAALAGRLSSFEGIDVPPVRLEAPPFGGDAAPSTRTGIPCFAGVAIPSTKPATPKFGRIPVSSTTTMTPCFAGVATPSTVPETPGFAPSPRPMTPKFGDVAISPPRLGTPKLGDVAIPSPRPTTLESSSATPQLPQEHPILAVLPPLYLGQRLPCLVFLSPQLGWGHPVLAVLPHLQLVDQRLPSLAVLPSIQLGWNGPGAT